MYGEQTMQEDLVLLNQLFQAMKVKATAEFIKEGLRTRKYYIKPHLGEKISKIKAIGQEISLQIKSLSAPSFSLDTVTGHVVVETTTNDKPINIPLRNLINQVDTSPIELPLVLGYDMDKVPFVLDLAKAPHVLVGGTTGGGKSILCRTIIHSLMSKYADKDIVLGLIDPKGNQLADFKSRNNHHVSSYKDSVSMLVQIVEEMEKRYRRMSKKGVRNITELRKIEDHPYIVILIDELADIILVDQDKSFFTNLVRLLQKAREAGIHIIANTQRPSADIIKGLIKTNMPVQIALKTASNHDSRIIIGDEGAERLVGMGDMLVNANGKITRVQGAFS